MSQRFILEKCVCDVLLLFDCLCQAPKPPKAVCALSQLESQYDLLLLKRVYFSCVEEGLLELRPCRTERNKLVLPDLANIKHHRVLRVTSKGYRFLDESRCGRLPRQFKNALSTLTDAAGIASAFAAWLR